MNEQIIKKMEQIVGQDWVVTQYDKVSTYCEDETEPEMKPVACKDCIVVKPSCTNEVSEIMKYASSNGIPVVVRGGATGMAGGAVTIKPSIIISMERLKKIIEVDETNLTVECEAGVTLGDLIERFKAHKSLFFPIHPGDEGAQIGGMVATNAGGVRAVKYGVMRDNVKGLEVVLPSGQILNLGGKLIKNNTGYDIKDLIIGSEGSLAIVTKATLLLHAKEKYSGSLIVSFENDEDAVKAIPLIQIRGIKPLAIEYMEKIPTIRSAQHIGLTWSLNSGNVYLYFIVAANKEEELYETCEKIVEICEECSAIDSLIAESTKEQREILEIRSAVYPSLHDNLVDTLDVAVPISMLPDFMKKIKSLSEEFKIEIQTIGHIGDGNMHNFIMTEDAKKPPRYDELISNIYKYAVECGGAITAEHGIGKLRIDKLPIQFSEKTISIMREIKKIFDPNNILNPGTKI